MSGHKVVFGNINDTFIEEQWIQLSKSISNTTFYQEYQWIHAYTTSNAIELDNLKLAIVYKNNKIIAICPMQYEKVKRLGLKTNIWKIFWPNDMGVNDFVFAQIPENNKILSILINFLNQQDDYPWHQLELQNVPATSSIEFSLNNCNLLRLIKVYQHDSKYISCCGTYEETVAKISTKYKRNNRRKFRKLQKSGDVTYDYIFDKEGLETAFEDFLCVEAAYWKGAQKTALKHDDARRGFYRALLKKFAETEQCAIHTMKLNGKPIASQFAIISGDTLNLMKIGYDAEFHSIGPGGLLLDETLRRFSGHSTIKKVSFVTGAKWNDVWMPDVTKVNNHYIFNSNLLGIVAYIMKAAIVRLRKIKSKYG